MDMDRGHRFRDWSGMPNELLQDIFLKIDCLEDDVRFSRVCKEWLSVFRQVGPELSSTNPWLLLPENTKDNPEGMRKVYNPSNNKYYNLRIPETFGKNCWGSSLGWIVTYDGDQEINLFNPLTKSRLQLPPSNTMMPEQLVFADPSRELNCNKILMRGSHISKACVLKTKGTTEDACGFLVAVIHAHKRRNRPSKSFVDSTYLSIARPGDKTWTLIQTPEEMIIKDVVFWNEMLWFVDENCSLWYADLGETGPSLKAVKLVLEPHHLFHIHSKTYLVESSNHELLLVQHLSTPTTMTFTMKRSRNDLMISKAAFRPVSDEQNSDKKSPREYTHSFWIFKLDLSSKKWELVDNGSALGESSMFLGKNTSLLVDPTKHGTCKSKCIYFVDDHTAESGRALSIYSLDGSKLPKPEVLYDHGETTADYSTPFWFTPLLC